jgi:phage terminase large subunit-like protein
MATFTADMFGAEVVIPGSARMVENTYKGDGSTTFAPGDLIRINTSGQIVDAATDSDTVGSCHGMILTSAYSATAATTSQYVPIWRFGADTVLAMQIYDTTAADAQPQDLTVGTFLTIRNSAAGIWCVTTTTTKGIAEVVAIPSQSKWFDSDYAADKNYGIVFVKFDTPATAAAIQSAYTA